MLKIYKNTSKIIWQNYSKMQKQVSNLPKNRKQNKKQHIFNIIGNCLILSSKYLSLQLSISLLFYLLMGRKKIEGKSQSQSQSQAEDQTENKNQGERKNPTEGRVLLGKGAFSEVYLQYDEINNRKMAVKYIAQKVLHQYNYEREYQILTKLNHQSIIKCYGKQKNQVGLKLKMEYCQGKSLRQLINMSSELKKPLNRYLVINIIEQILQGLKHAKQNKIIHRDLKPDNILLAEQTTPDDIKCTIKIGDFGLSRGQQPNIKYTLGCGTWGYIAPQIYYEKNCNRRYDTRSDVWSLGIIIFELMTNILLLGKGKNNFQKNLKLFEKKPLRDYCQEKQINCAPVGKKWLKFIDEILVYQIWNRWDIDELIGYYQSDYKPLFLKELPPIQSQLQTKRQTQIKTQQQIQSPINRSNSSLNRLEKKKKPISKLKKQRRGPDLTDEHSNRQRNLFVSKK